MLTHVRYDGAAARPRKHCLITPVAYSHQLLHLLQGLLIPSYDWHASYWLGLKAVPRFPNFIWMDPTVAQLGTVYDNWGRTPSDQIEPVDAEPCAAARRDRANPANPNNYGWSSLSCSSKMPYICRMFGEGSRKLLGACASYVAG